MTKAITWVPCNPPSQLPANKPVVDKKKTEKKEQLKLFNETMVVRPSKRAIWSDELQYRFLACVEEFGDKSVPSVVLAQMNVVGISREQVASHLQKYRMKKRKTISNENKLSLSYLIN